MRQDTVKFGPLRLPRGLFTELADLAEREHRSINSQVVVMLESGAADRRPMAMLPRPDLDPDATGPDAGDS